MTREEIRHNLDTLIGALTITKPMRDETDHSFEECQLDTLIAVRQTMGEDGRHEWHE
jgi:hypothetical protein